MILFKAYGGQGVECSNLTVTGLHRLIESGTIRRYGFVGVGMALLEEVCHFGGEL